MEWSGNIDSGYKMKKERCNTFFDNIAKLNSIYTTLSGFKVFFMSSSMPSSRDLAGLAPSIKDSSLKPHCAQLRNQICLGKKIWVATYEEIHPKEKVSRVSQIRFMVVMSKLKRRVILNKGLLSQRLFYT